MPMYRPSTAPYQRVTQGQAWGQAPQHNIIGCALVSQGTSASAGSANRVYNYLKRKEGADFAIKFFKNASFGPYMINKQGTALIWN